jgi:hypothetical protein
MGNSFETISTLRTRTELKRCTARQSAISYRSAKRTNGNSGWSQSRQFAIAINRNWPLNPDRLRVIARTSSLRYKKTTMEICKIARELSVDWILESSVQRKRQGYEGSREIGEVVESIVRFTLSKGKNFCALGQKDQAFARFETASAEHAFYLSWFKVEPELDPFRSDPRFKSVFQCLSFLP